MMDGRILRVLFNIVTVSIWSVSQLDTEITLTFASDEDARKAFDELTEASIDASRVDASVSIETKGIWVA